MTERRNREGIELRARTTRSLEAALSSIPIFPLPQVVLFPEAVLPLHVFEPRYRTMLEECLATHGALVIAQLVRGEDEHGRPRIAQIAGGGVVAQAESMPDGRSNIVVLGQARLKLDELAPDASRPYRVARATVLEDLDVRVPDRDRAALVAAATMFATEVKKHDPQFSFRLPATLDTAGVADLCAFQLVVDAAVRQAVLDELDPRARVSLVLAQLALQHAAMMGSDGDRVLN